MRTKKKYPIKFNSIWINTYSMVIAILFFVFFYSISDIDTEKLNAVTSAFNKNKSLPEHNAQTIQDDLTNFPVPSIYDKKTVKSDFKSMQHELDSMYSDFKSNNFLNNTQILKQDKSGFVQITLPSNILFDKGKDKIKTDAIPILDSIAALLSVKYPGVSIEITGHTDTDPINVPRFPNNWFLSFARAVNTGDYFISEKSFSPDQIHAKGRGEFEPVAPNDTEENKSKNRRIEFKIYSSFVDKEDTL